MKRLQQFVSAALVALVVVTGSPAKAEEPIPLDPTLERDLEVENLRALLKAANDKIEDLRALLRAGGGVKDDAAAQRTNENLRALLKALNQQVESLKAQSTEDQTRIANLRRLLAVANQAATVGPEMTVRAQAHVQEARRQANGLGETKHKVLCVATYDVGVYSVDGNESVAQCVKQAASLTDRQVGLQGYADEINCRYLGKTHDACDFVLAGLRVEHFNRRLGNAGVTNVRAMPGFGSMKKGLRAVVVWDLGPSTEALADWFGKQLGATNARVDGLESKVSGIDHRVRVLEQKSSGGAFSFHTMDISLLGRADSDGWGGGLKLGFEFGLTDGFGFHLGVTGGRGSNPELNTDLVVPQSDPDASGAWLASVILGFDIGLGGSNKHWSLVIDSDLGMVWTGEIGTKDEGRIGGSVGPRYSWSNPEGKARPFIQVMGGYDYGFSGSFPNRHLWNLTLEVGTSLF